MDTTVKDIAAWTRSSLDQAESLFGTKAALYRHLQDAHGLSEFSVRNFHKGEKDNPTQNFLDRLADALRTVLADKAA